MKELKILALDPGGGTGHYVILDSIEGFLELGHRVDSIKHKRDETWEESLKEKILEFNPDLVYAVNHIGIIPDLLTSRKIFHASWFIDDPFLWWLGEEKIEDAVSSHCVMFVCDPAHIGKLREIGFEHVHYLTFATNPKIFKPIELTEEDKEKFTCNISFAGCSLNSSDFQRWYRWTEDIAKRQPEAKTIMDEVIRLKSQNPMLEISDILNEVQNSFGASISFKGEGECEAFLDILEHKANSLYRKKIIEAVKDFDLYLYGDDGWRDLTPSPFPLALGERIKVRGERDGIGSPDGINFFGSIDNRTDLPKLYNATKINLNITQSQTPASPPIRPFDIAACGRFLLSDYRRELGNLFEIDNEIVCYRDRDNLRKKVKYYLNHPEEREEIARGGQERVLKEHTYRHRMQKLIDTIREIFG